MRLVDCMVARELGRLPGQEWLHLPGAEELDRPANAVQQLERGDQPDREQREHALGRGPGGVSVPSSS